MRTQHRPSGINPSLQTCSDHVGQGVRALNSDSPCVSLHRSFPFPLLESCIALLFPGNTSIISAVDLWALSKEAGLACFCTCPAAISAWAKLCLLVAVGSLLDRLLLLL